MSVMAMAAHSPASIINNFGLTPLGGLSAIFTENKSGAASVKTKRRSAPVRSIRLAACPALSKAEVQSCTAKLFSERTLIPAEKFLSCRKVIYHRRRFPKLHTWRQGQRDPWLWKFSARHARKVRSAFGQLRLLFFGIVLREGKGMPGRPCKGRVCCSPEQWERCCRQQA